MKIRLACALLCPHSLGVGQPAISILKMSRGVFECLGET
jgi:hypothetical protein